MILRSEFLFHGPLYFLPKEVIETRSEIVDYILSAVDDKDTVMDVKELVDEPHHGMGLGGLGPKPVLEFPLEEDHELVLHP